MCDRCIERVEDGSFVDVRMVRRENEHVFLARAYSAFLVGLLVVDQGLLVFIVQLKGTDDVQQIDGAKQSTKNHVG